jgi:radical SAM protein with 4Fe4S-binding SPASM domain
VAQRGLVQQLTEKVARGKIPFACHFDLTYRCNLECVHCYVVKEDRPELSASAINDILDQLAKAGTLYLTFSGGEIFTREDLFEIAEYARRLHFALRLMTNGTLVDEQVADRVANLYPDLVSISIYSTAAEIHDNITSVQGSLSRTISAAKMLRDRKIRVRINTVVMRQNVNEYLKVYELAQSIGASFQGDPRVTPKNDGNLSPLRFQINEDDLFRVLANPIFRSQPEDDITKPHFNGGLSDIPCGAGHMSFYVSPYGDVSPCIQFPILCGNLRNDSFEKIWYNSPQMLGVRSVAISRLPLCSKCDLLEYCRTCPGLGYIEEGNFRLPSKRVCQEARIIKETQLGG